LPTTSVMTPPRYNAPGTTWLVTRRCSERRFFLRPDTFVTRALLFVLGFAVALYGVEIHAAVALSNHWHLVLTDVRGKKSAFVQFVHSMIGRAINAFRGRFEAFWSPGRPCMVQLLTRDDILDKMVYVMLNPVRAGLVERVVDWPGLVTKPEQLVGGPRETERPRRFFDPRGVLGASTRFAYTRPPGFDDLSDEELVSLLRERVEAGEKALAAERGQLPAMKADAVLKQHWNSAPKSHAPRFRREPHVACRDQRLRVSALLQLVAFREAYRDALRRFQEGRRGTLFPFGTLQMRQRFRVRCATAPPEGAHAGREPPGVRHRSMKE
jgi:putative transposase